MQIGLFVYLLEKLRMLQFYYEFLTKFFKRNKFELFQMDTNLLYSTISTKSVEDVLKSEMRLSYYKDHHLWLLSWQCDNCAAPYNTAKVTNQPWSLKHSCAKLLKLDKHISGLFKLEFRCEGIVSLCFKTYICVSSIGNKLPHKGLNASQNLLRCSNYKKVFNEATHIAMTNKGIQVWNKTITT